jgi:hypothetical protein
LWPICPTTRRHLSRPVVTLNTAKPKRTPSSNPRARHDHWPSPHSCRPITYCRRSPFRPRVCGTQIVPGCV